jgi:hypothetical protein
MMSAHRIFANWISLFDSFDHRQVQREIVACFVVTQTKINQYINNQLRPKIEFPLAALRVSGACELEHYPPQCAPARATNFNIKNVTDQILLSASLTKKLTFS